MINKAQEEDLSPNPITKLLKNLWTQQSPLILLELLNLKKNYLIYTNLNKIKKVHKKNKLLIWGSHKKHKVNVVKIIKEKKTPKKT